MNFIWLAVALFWLTSGAANDNPTMAILSIVFFVLAFTDNNNPRPL